MKYIVAYFLIFITSVSSWAQLRHPITIQSNSLTTRLDSNTLYLKDQIAISYRNITLSTSEASFDYKEHQLIIPEPVTVTQNDLTFKSNKLVLSQLTGVFTGSGDVHITYPPYEGRAEKIQYLNEKNVIILTGNPTFITDSQKLEADTLILNTETRKIESKGKTRYSSLKKPRS